MFLVRPTESNPYFRANNKGFNDELHTQSARQYVNLGFMLRSYIAAASQTKHFVS
jgi:hypothetical protein